MNRTFGAIATAALGGPVAVVLSACGPKMPTNVATRTTGTGFCQAPGGGFCGGQLAHTPMAALTGYLNAVERGDCQLAEKYVPPLRTGDDGDLCMVNGPGPLRFDNWRLEAKAPPKHPNAYTYEYGVQLHITAHSCAGDICSNGWHTWFLEFSLQGDGYRLSGGGTGP